MGRIVLIVTVFAFVLTLGAVQVFADTGGHSHSFDWFRDADGDGIPNGLDDDWVRPEDGTGYKMGNGFGTFLPVTLPTVGDKNQRRYQRRENKPETPGDHLRARLRLGDQTCK